MDQLVDQYEGHGASTWGIDWSDSRYEQMMRPTVFFSIKISSVEAQTGAELTQTIMHQENSLYSACTKLGEPKPESEQNIVYIPKDFYQGRPEPLLELIKDQKFALTIHHKQNEFSARYINLRAEENMKPLLASTQHDAKEDVEALMLLKGPHCYVSPRFYQTKVNVPTWNYAQIYIEGIIKAGQFEATSMFGKFKLSQNRTAKDQISVCGHLSTSADDMDKDTARCMHQFGMKI